jgi:hypothetical protein
MRIIGKMNGSWCVLSKGNRIINEHASKAAAQTECDKANGVEPTKKVAAKKAPAKKKTNPRKK